MKRFVTTMTLLALTLALLIPSAAGCAALPSADVYGSSAYRFCGVTGAWQSCRGDFSALHESAHFRSGIVFGSTDRQRFPAAYLSVPVLIIAQDYAKIKRSAAGLETSTIRTGKLWVKFHVTFFAF